jgi:hypothetical protein
MSEVLLLKYCRFLIDTAFNSNLNTYSEVVLKWAALVMCGSDCGTDTDTDKGPVWLTAFHCFFAKSTAESIIRKLVTSRSEIGAY